MDLRLFGLDVPLAAAIHHMLDFPDDRDSVLNHPTRLYVRNQRAMASTPADVKELPNSYVFVVDMPGIKSGDISVQVEDGNVLVVSGKRKREEDKDGRYLAMERRIGKFMRRFALPENADTEKVAAVCRDGVLSVSVEKVPPPEPKKPKMIEVKIA